jgi:alkaline phosphatase
MPFFLTLMGTLTIVLAVTFLTSMDAPKPRNLVLMVSDGMGPASLSLARSYMQYTQGLEFDTQLPLDRYIIGTSRTRSSSLSTMEGADGR